MIYSRTVGARMGSQRRMFSRRTVIGLVTGVLLGFNLASWIAIPAPSHTDIEIEVIAQNGGVGLRGRNGEIAGFRLGAARVRRKHGPGLVKTGRDCNHEVIEYRNSEFGEKQEQEVKVERREAILNRDENEQRNANEDDDFVPPDEFDLEQERLKRQKELEVFYESDIETEDDGELPEDTDRLEDFQVPANVEKYVDYQEELTAENRRDGAGGDAPRRNRKGADLTESPLDPLSGKTYRRVKTASDRKHFIYIGVMTAQKYLATRGRAILDTWGNDLPGKVEFYVGEGVQDVDDGQGPLPLVRLATVKDDAYPPQKKSFLLLKRMYDAYLNSGYQWFMRADDDVYIKTEKLENFLRKLNSSQPIFLGQTGLGNAEERGRLSLPHGDNYCMGGPGMIFSREVLRRVGPHIRECVKHLYSWHEDVELSRCVRRFADVNCAWSYQMTELFYEHYSLRKGYIDPYIEPNNPKLYSALTLHPNKKPKYQVKLHNFMVSQKIQRKMTRIKELSREVMEAKRFLKIKPGMEEYMMGIDPTLHRYVPKRREDVPVWDFMTDRLWYTAPPGQARRAIPTDRQMTARGMVMRVMQTMNANSKARGRIIEFNQVAYGYRRINPLYGAEYVLDLLLVYKRFKGKKMTIPVRRHAYLQQTFTRTVLHERSPLDAKAIGETLRRSRKGIITSLMSSVIRRSKSIMSLVGVVSKDDANPRFRPVVLDGQTSVTSMSKAEDPVRYDTGNFTSYTNDVTYTSVPTVHIIIPLKGRFETFRVFMANLEQVSLLRADPVSLLVILFQSDDPLLQEESRKTEELLGVYADRYPQYDLRSIPIRGSFSRGLGLEIGASHFSNDSLLFFCDIDVVYDVTFMRKCRANSVLRSQVYYPILFSQFHPDFEIVLSSRKEEPEADHAVLRDASVVRRMQAGKDHFRVADSMGYWRSYGYGLLCAHKADFAATGGFNISIQGWGMEDVDLVDKFATGSRGRQASKMPDPKSEESGRRRVSVFRSPDPSLVHVYHPSRCDPKLADNQLRMCKASRASGIASVNNLARAWKELGREDVILHTVKDPVSGIVPVAGAADLEDREPRSDKDARKIRLQEENKPGGRRFKDDKRVNPAKKQRLKRDLSKNRDGVR